MTNVILIENYHFIIGRSRLPERNCITFYHFNFAERQFFSLHRHSIEDLDMISCGVYIPRTIVH